MKGASDTSTTATTEGLQLLQPFTTEELTTDYLQLQLRYILLYSHNYNFRRASHLLLQLQLKEWADCFTNYNRHTLLATTWRWKPDPLLQLQLEEPTTTSTTTTTEESTTTTSATSASEGHNTLAATAEEPATALQQATAEEY